MAKQTDHTKRMQSECGGEMGMVHTYMYSHGGIVGMTTKVQMHSAMPDVHVDVYDSRNVMCAM